MDKRYQVFVSSTYSDLRDERQAVMQALMEMDCIPSGMELFPAVDEQQWAFIRRVIDDCDYYLLIIGGRYGSLTSEGISYTEKEYDYAAALGLPIVAFLHGAPQQLTVEKSDLDHELRAKLEIFRCKVSEGRLVKFWTDAAQLPGLVALSLQKTIKAQPRVGWVRANALATADALGELNELRKRNESLMTEVTTLRARQVPQPMLPDLAPLDAPLVTHGTYHGKTVREKWQVKSTWRQVFALVAPYLLQHPNDTVVKSHLTASLFSLSGKSTIYEQHTTLDDQLFQTIKIQLMAHGLVEIEYSKTTSGGMALFWNLSESGRAALLALRTVRSPVEGGGA